MVGYSPEKVEVRDIGDVEVTWREDTGSGGPEEPDQKSGGGGGGQVGCRILEAISCVCRITSRRANRSSNHVHPGQGADGEGEKKRSGLFVLDLKKTEDS